MSRLITLRLDQKLRIIHIEHGGSQNMRLMRRRDPLQ